MSRILKVASAAAVSLTAAAMLLLAEPGFASDVAINTTAPAFVAEKTDLAAPTPTDPEPSPPATAPADLVEPPPAISLPTPNSLAELVAATPKPVGPDAELNCLATAVYYESRGESLAGQLAVARVVINRAESGRFAPSYCGVVTQRGQFSFVRGGHLPTVRASRQWDNALAIARIARDGSWQNTAPGALYFHARRVSPGWRRTRVAQIDNHIFYR